MAWFLGLNSIRAREVRLRSLCDQAAQHFGPAEWPVVLDFVEQFAALSGGDPEVAWRVNEEHLRLKLRGRQDRPPAQLQLQQQLQYEEQAPQEPEETKAGAMLISSRGKVFHLNVGEAHLGRRDEIQRVFPQVDLTAENPQRTIHRRHARVFCHDGDWFIAAEPDARNGTFVNRRVVLPTNPVPLHDGDRIQLSRQNPVELTFRLAS